MHAARRSIPAAWCRAALACACAAAAASIAGAGDLPTYRVQLLGQGLTGMAMNEHGTVVGRRLDAAQVGHAFVVRAGGTQPEDLPVPAAWTSSDAYAVSGHGVIVGAVSTASIASIGSRAAAWHPDGEGWTFTLLAPLPGDVHAAAFGVNDHGDIVGGSGGLGLGMYRRAALFTANGAIQLDGIGTPADVNDQRLVLSGNQLLDLASMQVTTIPLPPGNWQGVQATDLSEAGGLCGTIMGFSGCSNFAVRWTPAAGWETIGGCATTTAAVSVNSRGDALHFVQNGGTFANMVPHGNLPIESMIDPAEGSFSVSGASVITDARMMLASVRPAGSTAVTLARLVPRLGPDLDGDGTVGGSDLGILLGAWGTPLGDLTGDGTTGGADLGALLGAWTAG